MRIAYATLFYLFSFHGTYAQSCNLDQIANTTTPAASTAPATIEQTRRLLSDMPGSSDIVLVGDSLIQYWPRDQLQKFFGRDKIWNYGVGGDKTQTVLSRLESDKLSSLKPSSVIVLVGTTNVGAGNAPCAIVAALSLIAKRLAYLWPNARIYFLPIPPRGDDFSFKATEINEINNQIGLSPVEFPNSKRLQIDLNALTCGYYGTPLPENTKKFNCNNYWNDHLHFSATGYEILTKSLRQVKIDQYKPR
jgi:lysophospholipase L1-like esterase